MSGWFWAVWEWEKHPSASELERHQLRTFCRRLMPKKTWSAQIWHPRKSWVASGHVDGLTHRHAVAGVSIGCGARAEPFESRCLLPMLRLQEPANWAPCFPLAAATAERPLRRVPPWQWLRANKWHYWLSLYIKVHRSLWSTGVLQTGHAVNPLIQTISSPLTGTTPSAVMQVSLALLENRLHLRANSSDWQWLPRAGNWGFW